MSAKKIEETENEQKNKIEISVYDKLKFSESNEKTKVQTRKFEVIKEKIDNLYKDLQLSKNRETERANERERKLLIKQKFASLSYEELEELSKIIDTKKVGGINE